MTKPAPKAPPRKAKAVKSSASKRKQASPSELDTARSVASEVKSSSEKPAAKAKTKPAPKAPVQKAKSNGQSVSSIFATDEEERKDSALH